MKHFKSIVLLSVLFIHSQCVTDYPDYLIEKEVTINKATQDLIEKYKAVNQFQSIKLIYLEDTRDSLQTLIIDARIGEKSSVSSDEVLDLTKSIAESFYESLSKDEIQNVYKVEVWLGKKINDGNVFTKSKGEHFTYWIQGDGSFKTNHSNG